MPAKLQFSQITLLTTKLAAMRKFYAETLGFPIQSEGKDWFSLQLGATTLEFKQGDLASPPMYHFAFNISENKIDEAYAWVKKRIAVVNPPSREPIFHFAHWNAHAFYFLDPEGNLGEFIARHTLKNASDKPFSLNHVESVSELGIVTADVVETSQTIIGRLGIACYPDAKASPGDSFQALGSDAGLFIVVKRGRVWLASDRTAEAFASHVKILGNLTNKIVSDTQCLISGSHETQSEQAF